MPSPPRTAAEIAAEIARLNADFQDGKLSQVAHAAMVKALTAELVQVAGAVGTHHPAAPKVPPGKPAVRPTAPPASAAPASPGGRGWAPCSRCGEPTDPEAATVDAAGLVCGECDAAARGRAARARQTGFVAALGVAITVGVVAVCGGAWALVAGGDAPVVSAPVVLADCTTACNHSADCAERGIIASGDTLGGTWSQNRAEGVASCVYDCESKMPQDEVECWAKADCADFKPGYVRVVDRDLRCGMAYVAPCIAGWHFAFYEDGVRASSHAVWMGRSGADRGDPSARFATREECDQGRQEAAVIGGYGLLGECECGTEDKLTVQRAVERATERRAKLDQELAKEIAENESVLASLRGADADPAGPNQGAGCATGKWTFGGTGLAACYPSLAECADVAGGLFGSSGGTQCHCTADPGFERCQGASEPAR